MPDLFPFLPARPRLPLFQGEGAGAGAGAGAAADALTSPPADAPPADAPPANPAAAGKWWQAPDLSEDEQKFLTAKGYATDDLTPEVAIKMVKSYRAAEAMLGKKGLPLPDEGKPYADWAKANAAALGLPEGPDGYAVEPPKDWPKDMLWDASLETAARDLAARHAVHPEAHRAYVGMFADHMKAMTAEAEKGLEQARQAMMGDLTRDFGDQVPAVINRARVAAQLLAEQAGLSGDALRNVTAALSQDAKVGDAGVIRLFEAVGRMMGEDTMVQGGAQTLGTTVAEARAQLARMQSPDSHYAKAVAANDRRALAQLEPERQRLLQIVASAG